MRSRPYPTSLFALVVFIAFVNLLAETYYWYWRMRWFDLPMHFLGGVWLGGTALWLYYVRREIKLTSFTQILAVSLFAATGIGLLFELFQAFLGLETVGHASRLTSTMLDLLFDTLGGIAVASIVWLRRNIINN